MNLILNAIEKYRLMLKVNIIDDLFSELKSRCVINIHEALYYLGIASWKFLKLVDWVADY